MKKIERHEYWPDLIAMGDCLHCGRLQTDPIHTMLIEKPSGERVVNVIFDTKLPGAPF